MRTTRLCFEKGEQNVFHGKANALIHLLDVYISGWFFILVRNARNEDYILYFFRWGLLVYLGIKLIVTIIFG